MPLDRAAASEAISLHVARSMGVDVMAASWGIHEVINEDMNAASTIPIRIEAPVGCILNAQPPSPNRRPSCHRPLRSAGDFRSASGGAPRSRSG
jgi:hypothetical protein